jgi:acid phosphatase (class A)
MTFKHYAGALLMVVAFGTGQADSARAKEPIFVPLSQFDAREVLHVPPANDSDATKAELKQLHKLQDARTPQAFEKAKADGENETVFLFAAVFGDGFNAEKLPATAAFFQRVGNDEGVHANVAKDFWKRPRPFVIDDTIHPCGPGKSFSYPSGHATRGYLLGVVLAAAVPEKRDAILERSADYGRSRLICGVHFRSDVDAGRMVGTSLAAIMLSQPAFRQELDGVRAELKAAGFVPGG